MSDMQELIHHATAKAFTQGTVIERDRIVKLLQETLLLHETSKVILIDKIRGVQK